MKWFKHYTDASFDSKLGEVEQKFGLTGYAVYFKILEICALQWDGKSEPKFKLNKKKTKNILSLNYKKTESILSLFSVLNLFFVEISENFYEIEIPNLAKIKDNHTKNLQAPGKLFVSNLPPEKKRKEKKRTNKKSSFDLDAIYAEYPKKVGKKKGMEKLQKIIKDQDTYDKVMQGVINYKNHHLEKMTDQQFIKGFSVWVNGEHWNDEYSNVDPVKARLHQLEQELINL